MSVAIVRRDYSLIGPESERAVAVGLASAKWYVPPVSRAEIVPTLVRQLTDPSYCARRELPIGARPLPIGAAASA